MLWPASRKVAPGNRRTKVTEPSGKSHAPDNAVWHFAYPPDIAYLRDKLKRFNGL
jgi:hypothetical protein